ncbi:MAG: hypothetical protein FJ403_06315 [Verrucomicrobia bacterium]|nr:hypothetical protein [Verrucomicrobiota bacterium]
MHHRSAIPLALALALFLWPIPPCVPTLAAIGADEGKSLAANAAVGVGEFMKGGVQFRRGTSPKQDFAH